jgi:hypothetical protein
MQLKPIGMPGFDPMLPRATPGVLAMSKVFESARRDDSASGRTLSSSELDALVEAGLSDDGRLSSYERSALAFYWARKEYRPGSPAATEEAHARFDQLRRELQLPSADRVFPPPQQIFHGGDIIERPQIVPLYLGDYWSATEVGRDLRSYLDGFAAFVGQSRFWDTLHQYGIHDASYERAGTVAGSFDDVMPVSQVEQLIAEAISSGVVPKNRDGIYTVYLPPGTITDRSGRPLGFHNHYYDATGERVAYAVAVHPSTAGFRHPRVGSEAEQLTWVSSHEWAETAVDPDYNVGWRSRGWYDPVYQEIGDTAEILFSEFGVDDVARVDGFVVNPIWSNADNATVAVTADPNPQVVTPNIIVPFPPF